MPFLPPNQQRQCTEGKTMQRSSEYINSPQRASLRLHKSGFLAVHEFRQIHRHITVDADKAAGQIAKKHRRRFSVETATDAQEASARKLAETRRHGARMPDEVIYLLLLLLQLLELVQLEQCPAARAVRFEKVTTITKTPVFCAATNAGVTQSMDTDLKVCSKDCADDDACVGFNHLDPQLVCVKFQNPLDTLLLTDGCTHYEVSHTRSDDNKLCRNICTAVLYRESVSSFSHTCANIIPFSCDKFTYELESMYNLRSRLYYGS